MNCVAQYKLFIELYLYLHVYLTKYHMLCILKE